MRHANGFGVSVREIQDLQAYGPEWKFHAARLIPETLRDPTAILEGLKRHGLDDALCYVTVPDGTWIRDGIEGPFPPGRVFLVFAAKRDWGFVVLDWESREAEIDDPGCPKNWREDFERRIWPTNLWITLRTRKAEKFRPHPHYYRDSDSLSFFFKDHDAIARRVDELLTIYVSADTEELVGAKIKGVRQILSTLGNFGVTIKDAGFTLGMLFLAGMAVSRELGSKSEYIRVGESVKSVPIDLAELQAVG